MSINGIFGAQPSPINNNNITNEGVSLRSDNIEVFTQKDKPKLSLGKKYESFMDDYEKYVNNGPKNTVEQNVEDKDVLQCTTNDNGTMRCMKGSDGLLALSDGSLTYFDAEYATVVDKKPNGQTIVTSGRTLNEAADGHFELLKSISQETSVKSYVRPEYKAPDGFDKSFAQFQSYHYKDNDGWTLSCLGPGVMYSVTKPTKNEAMLEMRAQLYQDGYGVRDVELFGHNLSRNLSGEHKSALAIKREIESNNK